MHNATKITFQLALALQVLTVMLSTSSWVHATVFCSGFCLKDSCSITRHRAGAQKRVAVSGPVTSKSVNYNLRRAMPISY